MSTTEEQQGTDARTPTERLSYGLQSTAELEEAMAAVGSAIQAAEATILGAKKRKEELAAELAVRKQEDHKATMAGFACPKCANGDLSKIMLGDPCGYDWHPLEDGAVREKNPIPVLFAGYADGADYAGVGFTSTETGASQEVPLIRVAHCAVCEHNWAWPEQLNVEYG